ncbi:DUF3027 domain-containing protein [Corynebacterium marinum]|jgi:hypothetical protein|uniref:DUF3027 domain-containing protein n=2 Tax=Corynebacterium marinum TaxID=349751 RepID=A0A0B6TPT4_9CORY|nr:hypothetical protein B840_03155 [Corynebacterium marinum DSM 44953]NLF91549.1 DUF3027 domain-containing protein [Corynebacterium marinum]GGO16215.1 hypothetical protein GCM10010980_12390 [Corynebacterium marinum]
MGDVSASQRRRKSAQQRSPLLDASAVDLARTALEELGEGPVGEHIGVQGLTKNVATHRFAAEVPGYSGWEWNAVLACASGSSHVTVNELALVPAPTGEALRAPEWVPWADRIRPGDLGPGDLMPPEPGDERLAESEDGRLVLSAKGLEDAKQRWRTGDYGPTSEFAEKAALSCRTCAFFVPAGEPLGENFGACVNVFSADGHIVHAAYGCGAHSETPPDMLLEEAPDAFDDEYPIF